MKKKKKGKQGKAEDQEAFHNKRDTTMSQGNEFFLFFQTFEKIEEN